MAETVSTLGETGLIQRLSRRLVPATSVLVGIGDDAAVLHWGSKELMLFASDMLVEGVHFRRHELAPRWIGWKALACNISDIAAMGGLPKYAVVSLGLPRGTAVRFVDGLYGGLAGCARRFRVAIVGGDTVRAPCVVLDVAIVGTVKASRIVLRSGAKVGDRIFVTGRLGGSLVSQRHAKFFPRLREAQWLIRHLAMHAMIDLSDGLATDLWHLARASRVTMQVSQARIPVAEAAKRCLHRDCPCRSWPGDKGQWHALMDGEDYELVFTVPSRMASRVPQSIGRVPVTEIGMVTTRGADVSWLRDDGEITSLVPESFQHF